MKTVSSITTILKIVIKYGALITVLVKVIQYAVDEVEALGLDKETKKVDE
jgi:hypothetical protein